MSLLRSASIRAIAACWASISPVCAPAFTLAKLAWATVTLACACLRAAKARSRPSKTAIVCPLLTSSPSAY